MYHEVAEFVLARIAEAEAEANAVQGDKSWDVDRVNANFAQVVSSDGAVTGGVQTQDAIHIARWDPDHVLAQCVVHRAIVEEWLVAAARTDGRGRPAHWHDPQLSMMLKSHGQWILMLAAPHAEHPDYDQRWNIRILSAEQRVARQRELEFARQTPMAYGPEIRRALGLPDLM